MTPRLFVDVDDTLILWSKDLRNGLYATHYEPNIDVVHFVRVWRQFHPDGEITVWSLGGKDYAEKHASDHLPGLYDVCVAKYPRIPNPGEVYLDDDPLPIYRAATIHPDGLGE